MIKKVLIVVFILLLSAASLDKAVEVYAWDDCPKGLVNDEYPGSCSLYIDTDENGICDHSEPAPENRVDTTSTKSEPVLSEENVSQTTNGSDTPTTSRGNTYAVLAVIVPLIILVGYMGIKKLSTKKIT